MVKLSSHSDTTTSTTGVYKKNIHIKTIHLKKNQDVIFSKTHIK